MRGVFFSLGTTPSHDPRLDCAKAIIGLFNAARKTAHVAIFTLTERRIVDAMIAARKRGVTVAVVTDAEQSQSPENPVQKQLIEKLRPQIALLDIQMPGLNGLEVLARVRHSFPDTRVLILSMYSAEEYVLQAMRAGAHGYLVKSDSPTELELALKAVARGDTFLSSAVSKHVISGYVDRQNRKSDSKSGSLES